MNCNHEILKLAIEKDIVIFGSISVVEECIETRFLDIARKQLNGNITRIVCPISAYITLDAELHLERMNTKFDYEDLTETYLKEGCSLPAYKTKICIFFSGNKYILGAI